MSRLTKFGTLAAAALLVALPVSGCTFMAPQTTTKSYDASDGIGVTLGDVELRNAIVVAESADSPGRLIGTIVNQGSSAATLHVRAEHAGTTIVDDAVSVPAGGVVELGSGPSRDDVLLDPAGAAPGALLDVDFTAGGQERTAQVPVLDGTLEEYAPYLPTATPTPEATRTAAATPEATPTD